MNNRYNTIKLAISAAVIILLYSAISFANRSTNQQTISSIEVEISNADQQGYLTTNEVLDRIENYFEPPLSQTPLENIKVHLIDSLVQTSPYIFSSSSYVTLNGKLIINIKQHQPILRIINSNNESYYLTKKGLKMPTSAVHTAKVIIATGYINEPKLPLDSLTLATTIHLHKVAMSIDQNEFLKSITGQIIIQKNQDITLVTKAKQRHNILIGSSIDIDEKIDNLMQFYTKVLPVQGWDKYSNINLKFQKQIIAK